MTFLPPISRSCITSIDDPANKTTPGCVTAPCFKNDNIVWKIINVCASDLVEYPAHLIDIDMNDLADSLCWGILLKGDP